MKNAGRGIECTSLTHRMVEIIWLFVASCVGVVVASCAVFLGSHLSNVGHGEIPGRRTVSVPVQISQVPEPVLRGFRLVLGGIGELRCVQVC